jgi:probable F420-dependent oxidoreductase
MNDQQFRFGVNIIPGLPRNFMQEICRQAEDLGFDIITVSDYITLDLPAALVTAWSTMPPFIALAAAAEVTQRIRLGTYSLNASLYRPALLAREVIAAQQFTEGRLELGLGAGYLKADFEAAEIPWANAAERIDRLERLLTGYRRLVKDPAPPVLIGASTSEELLELATAEADIVSLTGAESKTEFSQAQLLDSARLAQQCKSIRFWAGERLAQMELNILVHAVHLTDDRGASPPPFPNVAELAPEELHRLPGVLCGSAQSIAEDLQRYRETYGISYYTFRIPNMADIGKVISVLR